MKNIIIWLLVIEIIVFCSLYFKIIIKLKNNHSKKYKELGKPTVFNFLWGRQFWLVLLFVLVNEYKELDDPLLLVLCKALKILTIINIIITVTAAIYYYAMYLIKWRKMV